MKTQLLIATEFLISLLPLCYLSPPPRYVAGSVLWHRLSTVSGSTEQDWKLITKSYFNC